MMIRETRGQSIRPRFSRGRFDRRENQPPPAVQIDGVMVGKVAIERVRPAGIRKLAERRRGLEVLHPPPQFFHPLDV
jgi:hypothetical protein